MNDILFQKYRLIEKCRKANQGRLFFEAQLDKQYIFQTIVGLEDYDLFSSFIQFAIDNSDKTKLSFIMAGFKSNKFGLLDIIRMIRLANLFSTIRCGKGLKLAVERYLYLAHINLVNSLLDVPTIKKLNFSGHSFGAAQVETFALIYQMLIDFYKNHAQCSEEACKSASKGPVSCQELRLFVEEFYKYQYENGFRRMWDENMRVRDYMRELYKPLIPSMYDAVINKFEELANVPKNRVISHLMDLDARLLKDLEIESVYSYGVPVVFDSRWAEIYDKYFYCPENYSNSKHYSVYVEGDLVGAILEDGQPYSNVINVVNMILTLSYEKRYSLGATIVIPRPSYLTGIEAHTNYYNILRTTDKFEVLPRRSFQNRNYMLILTYESLKMGSCLGAFGIILLGSLLNVLWVLFIPIFAVLWLLGF